MFYNNLSGSGSKHLDSNLSKTGFWDTCYGTGTYVRQMFKVFTIIITLTLTYQLSKTKNNIYQKINNNQYNNIIKKYNRSTKWIHKIQGDQLNTTVCFWFLEKSDLSSIQCTVAYTGQSFFFTGYQKNTAMFNGSG